MARKFPKGTKLGGQQFKATITKWAEKNSQQFVALARQSALQISENVVKATPVDTGFLRGSWQPSIGEPKSNPGTLDPSGGKAITDVVMIVNGMNLGDSFFMLNNAAYARRLEYGFVGKDSLGRAYNQPGRFYVTDNVKKWQTVVSSVAAELGF